ncbi:hypothetical protein C8034_v011857 [Colletotrichum sidae]|uniref:Uncharacterized protein n=1 Tax=Colletotrichum sidae TaxID=1347389 RepID=A0A4R8TEU7_9PEZI|nr:hypothetical protein C8034_v011857 [Colletotrichum sidae]
MHLFKLSPVFAVVLTGQALAAPSTGSSEGSLGIQAGGKEGQPCTGSVANLQQKGTCNANGKCAIEIPPNEIDIVASADCE